MNSLNVQKYKGTVIPHKLNGHVQVVRNYDFTTSYVFEALNKVSTYHPSPFLSGYAFLYTR